MAYRVEPGKKEPLASAPFVAIVDAKDREWECFESGFGDGVLEGAVNTLMVTTNTGNFAESRRLMQLARLRYPMELTPDEMKELGLNGFALDLAKRILLTKALREKGLPVMKNSDPQCANYLTKLKPVVMRTLGVNERRADELLSLLTTSPRGGKEAQELSEIAEQWFKDQKKLKGDKGKDDGNGDEGDESDAERSEAISQQALSKLLKALDEMIDTEMTPSDWFSKLKINEDFKQKVTWEPFPVKLAKAIPGYHPDLPWRIPKIIRDTMGATRIAFARAMRPSETGAIPRYIHRLMIDGMVFAHKRRTAGASVLIDCSGSMGVTQQQVSTIAQRFPAGIVAGYSGGEIRILADKGRCVVAAPPAWAGSNECDGPALEWLLRQSAPRVWISDGQVTMEDEQTDQRANDHCAALCRWGNVKRIPSMAAALARLDKIGNSDGD
jgi:hypothetical protein